MGEVYRARDATLGRDVAIKVLPDFFAGDADRFARFTREARTLASLNHPNIAHIHGFEECGGVRALVMELVEGDDLSQRIARGAIPLDEALPIANQIAKALEAAHEQGIVHRDLKPANIKVRPDGTVKVLDFGLAKPGTAAEAGGEPALTVTSPAMMTSAGVILGTAAYMSPEQARGQPVDHRTDIWSFGGVLFEMLAGRRCFAHADSISDAMAAILTQEPDWRALPADTPDSIKRLLHRCLKKQRAERLHHLADARIEIDEAMAAPRGPSAAPQPSARARTAIAIPWILAAVSIIVAAGLATQFWTRQPNPVEQPLAQFVINLPPGVEVYQGSSQAVAYSPTGTHVAFVGNLNGLKQVYVRDLGQLDAVPIRGSENANSCFFLRRATRLDSRATAALTRSCCETGL